MQELEATLHQTRNDAGIRALLAILEIEDASKDTQLRRAKKKSELLRLQGELAAYERIKRAILKGPAIPVQSQQEQQ